MPAGGSYLLTIDVGFFMAKLFQDEIGKVAFAFRGYNVTNLGRTTELLAEPAYAPILEKRLVEASEIATQMLGRTVDLCEIVRSEQDVALDRYSESVALIVATEVAQMELLKEVHDVAFTDGRLAFGFSLGELAAITVGGVVPMSETLRILLNLTLDAAALATDVTMGVVFTRRVTLDWRDVHHVCLRINAEGNGVIGVSSVLGPNAVIVLGQQRTVVRLKELLREDATSRVHVRVNPHQWPPLHTPIVWQRAIPNRAAQLLHTMQGGFCAPKPTVLSLVNEQARYDEFNCRELVHRWVDHPQHVWDGVYRTLAAGVGTVVHVGPQPNLLPATFTRISENVEQQLSGRIGLRAVSFMARRPWLASVLPSRSALLRAPQVQHVVLEDWLLENAPR